MNKWDQAQPDLDDVRGRLRAKSRQRPPIEVCSAVTGEDLDLVDLSRRPLELEGGDYVILASDGARYVTGQTILIDGGRWMI